MRRVRKTAFVLSGGASLGAVRLIRAGFDSTLAASLVTERAIDLHVLIELVERGCTPPIAVRILAPLDHERTAC
jgi:hypothetical protein